MRTLTYRELLPAYCRNLQKFALLVEIDPNNAAFALKLPCFEPTDNYYDAQVVADGVGFLIYNTREQMNTAFDELAPHTHIVAVRECNNKGVYERKNYNNE